MVMLNVADALSITILAPSSGRDSRHVCMPQTQLGERAVAIQLLDPDGHRTEAKERHSLFETVEEPLERRHHRTGGRRFVLFQCVAKHLV